MSKTVARDSRRHFTLRQQLAVLLAALVLGPLLISNLWGYLETRHQLTWLAFRDVRNSAALEVARAVAIAEARRRQVHSIVVDDEYLFGLVRARLTARDETVQRSLRNGLRRHLAATAGASESSPEMFVLSPAGEVLGSSVDRPAASAALPAAACLDKGRSGGGVAGFDQLPGEPRRLLVAAGIRDGETFLGVFCARFPFELRPRESSTGHTTAHLLDGTGHVVASTPSAAPPEPGSLVEQRVRERGLSQWEARYSIDTARSAPREEVIASLLPLGELGGAVLVESPVAEALAVLHQLERPALPAAIVLAVLIVLSIYVSSGKLAAPIRTLSTAARRAGEGALGERVVPEGPEELSELTRNFNAMSLALKEAHLLQERRIAERTRELRESREFAELLLNSIDQQVIVVDPSRHIIKANRAACRRYGEEVVGRSCCEVFGDGDSEESCPVARVFREGTSVMVETPERSGRDIVRRELFPVSTTQGMVEAVVQIGRVVTDEKRVQAQSVHSERMAAFGLLAAGVAHEIGNPLAAIESQLRVTQEDPQPSRVTETLGIVRREVRRISQLLRELVSFARRRRDDFVLVSIGQVVDDVTRLLAHDQRARNVRFAKSIDPSLPGVRAKEDQLIQVLLNLCVNALDAMPEGGDIRLSTEVAGGAVLLRVSDTGGGVPDWVRHHLGEAFYSTKAPGHGTGLGLFVSRGIVEGLGGTLELERSGADGSTFLVRLPAEGAERASASEARA